jgi:hypothetical protein
MMEPCTPVTWFDCKINLTCEYVIPILKHHIAGDIEI